MFRISTRVLIIVVALFLAAKIDRAQENPDPVVGLPPYGSFSGGPFDIVDNANLNVHLGFPVLVKLGRGLPFNFVSGFDTWMWTVSDSRWVSLPDWGEAPVATALLGKLQYHISQSSCTVNGTVYYYNIYYDFDFYLSANPGYKVDFGDNGIRISNANSTPCTGAPPYSGSATATDGSGITVSATAAPSATVTYRSGYVLTPPLNDMASGILTDTNGNQITIVAGSTMSFTDTLGQSVTETGTGLPSSPVVYQYTAASGAQATVQMNYTNLTVQTNFGCTGISESGPTVHPLPTSFVLADGTSYTLNYEVTPGDNHTPHYVTGRLASITLPTGGTISYSYTGGSNGITCADGSPAGLTRATPDGSWTYTRSGSWPAWTTTITDPQGNQIVMNFQGIYETERQVYKGSSSSGTLLDTIYTCYNGAAYPCNSTSITLPITQVAVTDPFPGGLTSQRVATYNSYALPTEVDEYGFASGSVGPLVRKTLTTYASLGNNIVDRPATVSVYAAGATNPSSQTTYTYDQGSVGTTSGTPQHISVSGSRGNPTTITQSVTGSTTISRTATYYDTGKATTATDYNGNQTSYTYGTSSCGNSFPTSIGLPLSLSRSRAWNCNGAFIASATDENGQTTNYSYDVLDRPTQTNFADGGWRLTNYTGANQRDVYTGITDSTPSTSCTSCSHTQVNLDGLGRESSRILMSDPEGQTTVSTSYDSVGRFQQRSNPYRSSSDPTYGSTQLAYDTLQRINSVTYPDGNNIGLYYGSDVASHGGASTQLCSSGTYGLGFPVMGVDQAGLKIQVWTDASHRIIEADEPDSSNNMTINTCFAYDPLNNRVQIVQGSQTRTYSYDMLSRKTSETTPEAGTTNYYYTTSGSGLCSGDSRVTCRRTDARGTTTTASYDALNRITSKTYSDSTPAANFYYDESSVTVGGNPYTLTNTKGRLSHTSVGSSSAITVQSYDKVGRHQDVWQCTPYNCSNSTIWNTHYNYDLAGDITSWKNPSNNTFTHTISNARRITQITSSLSDSTDPATIAQNIKYAPHGAVSQLQNGCVGTGCTQTQESYDYNNRLQPVRIRLGTSTNPSANSCLVYNYYAGVTNPTGCSIPSQASSGNNRSVVGDYFQDTTNPSLGHTVSYTYDNMHRLASSVATGSATHNLTFSYDRYGNMTCTTNQNTNGPCPNYTFSASTNQITNGGYTYDTSGNLTADGTGTGTHTYQWDAENRLKSIDNGSTATYSYNAIGQRVEKLVGSAYTEYAYHPSGGEVGENNRSTWSLQVIPFKGRHLAHYQNGTYFNHNNRLGTTSQVTDHSGAVAQDQLYYPWGQEQTTVGTAQEKRFAALGHRDETETGLDPTHFRMLSSTQGRWLSPDPAATRAMSVANPQTLNRYAYVNNSPVNHTDRLGLFMVMYDDGGEGGGGGGFDDLGGADWVPSAGLSNCICGSDELNAGQTSQTLDLGLPNEISSTDPLSSQYDTALHTYSPDSYPAGLSVVSQTAVGPEAFQEYQTTPNAGNMEWFGAGASVTYQVVDQYGAIMAAADMIPQEVDSFGYAGPTLAGGKGTDASGQYTDSPVGYIDINEFSPVSFTQQQYITYNNVKYDVGLVQWTVTASLSFSGPQATISGSNGVNVKYQPGP